MKVARIIIEDLEGRILFLERNKNDYMGEKYCLVAK